MYDEKMLRMMTGKRSRRGMRDKSVMQMMTGEGAEAVCGMRK